MRTKRFSIFALLFVLVASVGAAEDEATIRIGAITYTVRVAEEYPGDYQVSEWRTWDPLPGSCMTVRDKVLTEESRLPVTSKPAENGRCSVVSGWWICPYTGNEYTDASDVDVDHLVPLAEAYRSGGYRWDAERRREYSNYLGYSYHLIVVDDSENQSKGDRDPSGYLPRDDFVLTYLEAWLEVKARWGLSVDSDELEAIQTALDVHSPSRQYPRPESTIEISVTPAPSIPGGWSVTYLGATLERNDRVGNEWSTSVTVNALEMTEGTPLSLESRQGARILVRAVESDAGGNDVGEASVTIGAPESPGVREVEIEVTVTEGGGRYSGNTALWVFRFRVE